MPLHSTHLLLIVHTYIQVQTSCDDASLNQGATNENWCKACCILFGGERGKVRICHPSPPRKQFHPQEH